MKRGIDITAFHDSFATTDLVMAMAPIDLVISNFAARQACDLSSLESQETFASMLSREWNDLGPSHRYLRSLVRRFATHCEPEDDVLVELIYRASLVNDAIPDPTVTGNQTFRLNTSSNCDHDHGQVKIRVFPQHNDVALKFWEAGACLAEYVVQYPDMVRHKRVVELGAGVGLTGIVMAGCCQSTSVHMTDYSVSCLENMNHNIAMNKEWLQSMRKGDVKDDTITSGFLDWFVYAGGDGVPDPRPVHDAEVLVAADVAYDIDLNTALSKSVYRFLSGGEDRVAIFAMTLRNQYTFESFECDLKRLGIQCKYEDKEIVDNLPKIFPVYHVQPRSDVRIIKMSLTADEDE